jgi:hypothetical protein
LHCFLFLNIEVLIVLKAEDLEQLAQYLESEAVWVHNNFNTFGSSQITLINEESKIFVLPTHIANLAKLI